MLKAVIVNWASTCVRLLCVHLSERPAGTRGHWLIGLLISNRRSTLFEHFFRGVVGAMARFGGWKTSSFSFGTIGLDRKRLPDLCQPIPNCCVHCPQLADSCRPRHRRLVQTSQGSRAICD